MVFEYDSEEQGKQKHREHIEHINEIFREKEEKVWGVNGLECFVIRELKKRKFDIVALPKIPPDVLQLILVESYGEEGKGGCSFYRVNIKFRSSKMGRDTLTKKSARRGMYAFVDVQNITLELSILQKLTELTDDALEYISVIKTKKQREIITIMKEIFGSANEDRTINYPVGGGAEQVYETGYYVNFSDMKNINHAYVNRTKDDCEKKMESSLKFKGFL